MNKSLYKVIWWSDMENGYTESVLNLEGLDSIIEGIGFESILSIEEVR